MKMKVIDNNTDCCFMPVNKILWKLPNFKPRRHKTTFQKFITPKIQNYNKIRQFVCKHTSKKNYISNSSSIICFDFSTPLAHYSTNITKQKWRNSQNSRVLIFLQTNKGRSSDTDKLYFARIQSNISSLNLEEEKPFYRLTYSPTPI